MDSTSREKSPKRGKHDRGERHTRDRYRSRSSSRSLPSGSRMQDDRHGRRREEYRSRNDEPSRRATHRISKASPRSRSPKIRRGRARSSSSSEEYARRHRKASHGGRHDERARNREGYSDDNGYQGRSHRPQRNHREHPRSRERNRSPRRHEYRESNRRGRSDADTRGGTTERGDQHPEETPLPPEKEKPNYERSGKLAAETNRVEGTKIVLKYHEPPEARLPPKSNDWRMFEFKEKETVSTTELSKRSCWLVGREESVVDFPIAHPSCSSQHAVLQFRFVEKKNEYGERVGKVKLYVIDLESSNGTSLNGERIEDRRFIEVRHGDVVRFGDSTREYVFLLA